MDDSPIRRRVEIDRELWHALQPLMHEHCWSLQALLQQTPLTQNPLAHWVAVVQVIPIDGS